MKNNSALFYTCSLIEFIGRRQKLRRSELVTLMGSSAIGRIYRYADVFHCEPIAKTADDFEVPDYWTIGEVYERLIEDISGDDEEHIIERLIEVYTSWIDAAISNYNTDFYYQSREYICLCYREGKVCE